jgi:predicted oxidoreductase
MERKPHEHYTDIYIGSSVYQLTVEGDMDQLKVKDMTGMMVSELDGGRLFTITGKVQDQSSLNGLINTLYNMRLSVISIIKISS